MNLYERNANNMQRFSGAAKRTNISRYVIDEICVVDQTGSIFVRNRTRE